MFLARDDLQWRIVQLFSYNAAWRMSCTSSLESKHGDKEGEKVVIGPEIEKLDSRQETGWVETQTVRGSNCFQDAHTRHAVTSLEASLLGGLLSTWQPKPGI